MSITDPLAPLFLLLHVAQSLVHLLSDGRRAVLTRFALFAGQLGVLCYWLGAIGWRLLERGALT